MSRTGLYDCHIFLIFIDNFMRISNFGIGVLHVKVKFIFLEMFYKMAAVGHFGCLKFTFDCISGNFRRCTHINIRFVVG